MKKKNLMNVLAVAVTCAMLAGCSQQADTTAPAKAEEETIDTADTEEVAEEPEEVKEASYLLSITAANEDGTYSACDAEKTDYTLTLDETFPEEQKELLVPEAVVTVTGPEDFLADTENGKSFTITAVQAQEEDTEDSLAVKRAGFEKVNGFAVDDSVIGTMYAKQSVNVRKGPSTDYEKIGNLSFAQEINVTGAADNGWYQFDFDGQKGYVSNKYVAMEKPEAKAVASTGTSGGGSSAAASSGGGGGSIVTGPYTSAQIDEAMAAGDMDRAWAMYNANIAALTGEVPDNSSPTEKSTSTSKEFVDYLNQKRTEAGLSTLAWDDSLAATACERAEEIVSDFSHNKARNCTGENILKSPSSDVSSWFTAFYNSPGHRINMMSDVDEKAAAAVCKYGNTYYLVLLLDI